MVGVAEIEACIVMIALMIGLVALLYPAISRSLEEARIYAEESRKAAKVALIGLIVVDSFTRDGYVYVLIYNYGSVKPDIRELLVYGYPTPYDVVFYNGTEPFAPGSITCIKFKPPLGVPSSIYFLLEGGYLVRLQL